MKNLKRREFIALAGAATAGSVFSSPLQAKVLDSKAGKLKVALVGTGVRGISFWGKTIVDRYGDLVEYVGLCDINPGRVEFGKKHMGVKSKTYTSFEKMMKEQKPDLLIVTTVDATHHEFIIKGLEMGSDVITEKPMTTDEVKCQNILDAEKKSGRKVIVGFNYRYGVLFTKLKELLATKRVGELTSVDFHWYLNVYHGASYFRRWHRLKEKGGTLLVHKSTHHFDLLNWWIDSDPVEVYAYGKLEHYGENGKHRSTNCRACPHKKECKFYWDITENEHYMDLYVANEKHDGYLRDGCVFKEDVDIYDKMAVQIKYANDVQVSYSLTTYSPYEGWRIAFNGMDGRIDSWEGIPWKKGKLGDVSQAELHKMEMSQGDNAKKITGFDEVMVMDNFGEYESIKVPKVKGGHGGGDVRLHDKIFKDPNAADPLKHSAGTRDGAFSVLVGIAARKSIELGRPVKITELTDLVPSASRKV